MPVVRPGQPLELHWGVSAQVTATVVPSDAVEVVVELEDEEIDNSLLEALGWNQYLEAGRRAVGHRMTSERIGASGRVHLRVPAGRHRLSVRARGYRPQSHSFSVTWGEKLSLGEIRLQRGATLSGTVRDERGDGIRDAAVASVVASLVDGGDSLAPSERPPRSARALTGVDGSFAIRGIPEGEHSVIVEAPGFIPQTLRARTGVGPVDVSLRKAPLVRGTVENTDGEAVARASVKVGKRESMASTVGAFSLAVDSWVDAADPRVDPSLLLLPWKVPRPDAPAPPAQVTVEVDALGFKSQAVTVSSAADEALVVQLRALRSVACTIVDAAGAPLTDARAYLVPELAMRFASVADPILLSMDANVTGSDGRTQLSEPSALRAGDEFRVVVEHRQLGRSVSEPFSFSALPPEVKVALQQPGIVLGSLQISGRPVVGAALRLAPHQKASRDDLGEFLHRTMSMPRGGKTVYTGIDGKFMFSSVAPGDYVLVAEDASRRLELEREVTVAAGARVEADLEFPDSPTEIDGLVLTAEGLPAADAVVELFVDDPVRIALPAEARRHGPIARTRTDEVGAFLFESVPTGKFLVRAAKRNAGAGETAGVGNGAVNVELRLVED